MAKQETKATPSPEELLKIREEDLKSREEALKSGEEKLKSEIIEFEDFQETVHELSEKTATEMANLDKQKENVTNREVAVKEKEEALKARELAIEENSTPAESIENFEFEDEKYSFAKNAPQVINYGGQKFTRKQLIENEEVLLQLIGGNSSLITKI